MPFTPTRVLLCAFVGATVMLASRAVAQPAIGLNEILCRPTAASMSLSALFSQQAEAYVEWGRAPGSYARSLAVRAAAKDVPVLFLLDSLQADTRYYYRTRYRRPGDASFLAGPEHHFQTQRAPGATFRFTMEADPHPYDKKGSHTLWNIALDNQLRDSADFLFDLGDTFGDDHNPTTITDEEIRQLHADCRPFFGRVCHSSPMLFCMGNHEGESGYYLLQAPPTILGVSGTLWRKYYFPNPVPDGFYTGNTTREGAGIGLPENYYAFTWGDALFVVLDAYRGYTASAKPRKWDWTLGREQYDWFKQTLEASTAKFTFVITHHTLGETRGGLVTAKLYEWGGYEADGKTYSFDSNRPGWGLPIHQLMVKHGVNIFFQGHDHLFATEMVDGIVYQEVPMPSDSTYIIGTRDNGDAFTDVKIDASGHLRVTVSPDRATVEYVRAWLPADETAGHRNGEVAHTYTVSPKTTAVRSTEALPAETLLEQNTPNPFVIATRIRYALRDAGVVSLKVYDLLGKEVETLADGWQPAGVYAKTFDASALPRGMYFYQLRTAEAVITKKAVQAR